MLKLADKKISLTRYVLSIGQDSHHLSLESFFFFLLNISPTQKKTNFFFFLQKAPEYMDLLGGWGLGVVVV